MRKIASGVCCPPAHGTRSGVLIFHASTLPLPHLSWEGGRPGAESALITRQAQTRARTGASLCALALSRALRGRARSSELPPRLSPDRPRAERARAAACAFWRSPASCAGERVARSCLCAYHSTDPNPSPSATGRHPGNDRANERTDEDVEGGLLALSGVPVCLSVDSPVRLDVGGGAAWGCLRAYHSTGIVRYIRAHGRQPRALRPAFSRALRGRAR